MVAPVRFEGEILVITGPPGAGKSTVAARFVTELDRGVLLDGDSFFQSIRTGWIPPWEPDSSDQNDVVIDALGAAAGRFASGRYRVVVDGIIGPWLLERFAAAAAAPLHYAVLRPAAEVAMARATARGEPWLVEPAPIAKMHRQFADLGDRERYAIDTTDDDIDSTLSQVRDSLSAGRLRLS